MTKVEAKRDEMGNTGQVSTPGPSAFLAPVPLGRSTFRSSTVRSSTPSSVPALNLTSHPTARRVRTSQSPNASQKAVESHTTGEVPRKLPHNAIPYFAYFANMNPTKIGPLSRISARRCKIFKSQVALLPAHNLVFDVPGAPPEPVFANIEEHSSSIVHGVLHWLSPSDYARVIRSEGVLSESRSGFLGALPAFARIKNVEVNTKGSDGTQVTINAKTVVFNSPIPSFLRSRLRPSRRYVQVAIEGAKHWGMNKQYVTKLEAIPFERGPLGGFGLFIEPRLHLFDRPNLNEEFGKPSSEMYSPWSPIRSPKAVKAVEKDEETKRGRKLRLLRVSNTTRESTAGRKPLYYIPGIDGTGKGILSQVDGLDEEGIYDASTFVYPFENRQTLEQLAEDLIRIIREDAGDKPVTLVGESMGGVVSLLLAMENERRLRNSLELPSLNIDVLMMINPATSFKRSTPRALWDFLLGLGLSDEMYAQLLPPVLLPFIVDFDAVRSKFGPELVPRLRKLLFSLSELSDVLPQDALTWRLKLLSDVSLRKDELEPLSKKYGPSRIALISTMNDNLIPSHSESYKLRRHIPNIYTTVLPYGGHVPSFDSRFSLAGFLRAFNHTNENEISNAKLAPSPYVLKRRAAFRKRFSGRTDGKLNEWTREDLGRLRTFLASFTRSSSPVFTGLENIPAYEPDRPILFVCNHTLLGWLDAMYPVEKILKERNVLVRSLAHPKLFEQVQRRGLAFPNTPRVSSEDIRDFGIIQVNAGQLLEQLSNGNWSLLFPGGAREALKENEKQKYILKWPDEPEFIRACALFGAQIIPISTVGTEDMVRILASPKQVQEVLDRGSRLIGNPINWESINFEGVPRRDALGDDLGPLIPPLMLPSGPDRIYFRFGKPIDVDEACLFDEEMEKKMYCRVRDSVAHGIEVLKERRELDDYRSEERRREFFETYGDNADPPCGSAWMWSQNGSYLDDDKQPPLP